MTVGGKVTEQESMKAPEELEKQHKKEQEKGSVRVCYASHSKKKYLRMKSQWVNSWVKADTR